MVGKPFCLHQPAVGKAILSRFPEATVERNIDQWELPRATENTSTGREQPFDERRAITERVPRATTRDREAGVKRSVSP
ncbi:IclR family transcriptional regulator C-terminal domain-containing protein [Halomarina ordinaria]|uniref:IclR family transcriptional regulator C-terminal domain-containing protein n=1 Tax=Halomarina ordinaria TaxID=3033939 RepID=A0ABD5UGE1_9EURY|nr:IclR family transcriptional regulator C-terminal domain-containing protein [Halomarina sp. PSRA2]